MFILLCRLICKRLLEMLKGGTNGGIERRKNCVNKVLNAPIHMGSLASNQEEQVDDIKSIWVTTRDDVMVILVQALFIL